VTARRTAVRSRRSRTDEPSLFQFIVLSMLVHILAIMLFGATGRGGAGRSEDLQGALDVTLRRLSPEPGTGFRLAPGAPEARSPGRSLLPQREERPIEKAPPAPSIAPPETMPPIEAPVPAAETVPSLNPAARDEVDKPLRAPPESVIAPRIETSPQHLEPISPPDVEHPLAAPIEAPSRAIPLAPLEPLQRIGPPDMQRPLSQPTELPRRTLPEAPAASLDRVAPPPEKELATPLEPLRAQPVAPAAPIERLSPGAIEQPLSPPIEVPTRATPIVPPAPIERVVVPAGERPLAPPIEIPREVTPVVPSVPLERVVPPANERQIAPAMEMPAPSGAPRESETAPPVFPPAQTAPPAAAPSRPEGLLSPSGGSREPDDIFKPRADTPERAPRIDLDAAKKRAVREMAGEGAGSPGVLAFPLPIPEKKTKEANALEKAVKPDCRTAYAGMGLLAVPALVASAVSDNGGCRW
jgi:hypothetical protein